ncbi:MAG TPA: diacylglycerol kinase family protein [Anaerolineae bacterium]
MTTSPIRQIHVIINPAAGQAEPILNVLNAVLRPAGIKWEVFITNEAGDARKFAQRAQAAGVDIVAVYGGDGTVTEAASGLIGSNLPLAILPGGTANVTSIELGIPVRLEDAVALMCDAARSDRLVDMGTVGDKLFLGHVGIGLEADMHQTADRSLKDRFGILAYPIAALQALRDRPVAHYALVLDGERIEIDGLDCMVTNLGSIGILGATIAGNISVSDGLLDVIVIRGADAMSLGQLVGSLTGLPDPANPLPHWQVRNASITADPPQRVTADGEMLSTTPVDIKVLPGAIHIIVPANAIEKGKQAASISL